MVRVTQRHDSKQIQDTVWRMSDYHSSYGKRAGEKEGAGFLSHWMAR